MTSEIILAFILGLIIGAVGICSVAMIWDNKRHK